MRRAGPIGWCVLAALLFGASTPASKPLLDSTGPVFLSGLLYLGAALAVAPWALKDLSAFKGVRGASLWRLLGAVFFGGIVGPVLLLWGLSLAGAASVSLWLNMETVATALLAQLFFREYLGKRTWLAVLMIIAASLLLATPSIGGVLPGVLVALACVAWGLDNNLTAVIDQFTPAQVTFAKGLGAGLINLGIGVARAEHSLDPGLVGAALGIGALSYGASILLYVAGAQQLGATRSQLIFSSAPIWGVAAAWLYLGETLELAHGAAALLMVVAVWLWQSESHGHRHVHRAQTHTHWHRHDDDHHDHEHERADEQASDGWHSHEHRHAVVEHSHEHKPDLHHRHGH